MADKQRVTVVGRDKLTALATIDVQWRKIRLELGAEEVYLNKCISAPKSGTNLRGWHSKKGKGSPYSITERRVPKPIPVLGSQHAGDVSHKPGGRLPLLSTRPEVTPATLKRATTLFCCLWTEARWVWTVCLRLLPDSLAQYDFWLAGERGLEEMGIQLVFEGWYAEI